MPRWAKLVCWAAVVWTVALAVAIAVIGLTGDCAGVTASEFHVCELGRDSTISGLVLVWFLGFLPPAIVWLLAHARRRRCRICGDELGAGERRICRRCGTRLVETATR